MSHLKKILWWRVLAVTVVLNCSNAFMATHTIRILEVSVAMVYGTDIVIVALYAFMQRMCSVVLLYYTHH